ncbi:phosphotransferase family protein [Prauserella oleivorans]
MPDRRTALAVAAAVGAARRYGVPADAPDVLADRSNVLVRLGNVVARVPATTALARPDAADWLARDVSLASFLARRGAPVVAPTEDPPAGPHLVAGLPVTFWRYVRHDPAAIPAPGEVARSLAEIHEAARDYPGPLPGDGPVAELYRLLDLVTRDLGDAAPRLRADADRIAAEIAAAPGPRQVLHGDAHPGNLLATADGWRWIDFEDTWRGPLAWDLAVLSRTDRLDGAAAVAAYPGRRTPARWPRSSPCVRCSGCAGGS